MESIKVKKKSSLGDTEHIYVTPIYDEGGNTGYAVEILTLTKHPEMYKHDYILRLFRGYAVITQSNIWSESTLREILAAIDEIKKDSEKQWRNRYDTNYFLFNLCDIDKYHGRNIYILYYI